MQGGEGELTSTGAQVHTGGLWCPCSQEPAVLEAFLEEKIGDSQPEKRVNILY